MFRNHHMVISRTRLPGAGWSSRHHMTSHRATTSEAEQVTWQCSENAERLFLEMCLYFLEKLLSPRRWFSRGVAGLPSRPGSEHEVGSKGALLAENVHVLGSLL